MLSHTFDNTALALVVAVISSNYEVALNVFKELSLLNESFIGLLALLAHQFRLILQVKLLKQKGYNEYQMRNQIGGHPYPIKLASQRERNFTTDRKSTRLNSSHVAISYAVFCLKKKNK